MAYPRDVIYTKAGETILLKFVEAVIFERDSEGAVIDKLKDDFCFKVRTISGKEYDISARHVICKIQTIGYEPNEIAQSIYEKWLWINKS